ncbi:MAG: beta-galactosidase [Acidobacteriia bacterium]|nr:beta-galactosidase [Terriglobia bacterium]
MRRTLLMFLLAVCAAPAADPVFPYGAVYFRKSNPPEQDWARDHRTAAKIGMNNFRHWFMWSAIEVAPGKYDWRDYDRMMDLAAQNGIKVTIAEMVTAAPEWMFDQLPHARYLRSDGAVVHSDVSGSSAVGGFPGLCLDNDDVQENAGRFLTTLIERYKGHPAMWAWDLWNEHSYPGGGPPRMLCYCEATQKRFREWLKAKYGTLEKLGKAWYRYSYAGWDNVHPPRSFSGYPESLDWLEFRIDNQFRLHQWRVDLVRKLDKKNKVVAHGVASSLAALPSSANDEWRSAAQVDVWGFTWVASRKGAEPWKQFHAVDLVRAGSRGKPFWHAEAQAGPLWMQPQVIGRAREDGRIADEKDVRLWNLVSMAGGATGILYPRWRPLLDGPLFGAFGAFGMDGSMTPRAEMAGQVARWANQHAEVWKSRPIKGDLGIVFVPESQIFNFVQQGNTDHYAESVRGAYQAFFDSNIQADFVHIDHIQEYPLIYLPYPIHLKEATAKKLAAYVQQGGILVSEGLPGYFGERGKVGTRQPNYGLDQLFGVRESYVEFTPDLLNDLKLNVQGKAIGGRFFLQHYEPAGGRVAGQYAGGQTAAAEHRTGKGRSLLIGSFPGASYFLHHSPETKAFFASLLDWAGLRQTLKVSSPEVTARLHSGAGGAYLWVINPGGQPRTVTVTLENRAGAFVGGRNLWQPSAGVRIQGDKVEVAVEDRSAAVIRLEPRATR